LGLLRVDPAQPQEEGLIQALITAAKELLQPQDVLFPFAHFFGPKPNWALSGGKST
jgi:hypothetical protein